MFPQFGATAESLSKASSLVLRIGTDAHHYDDHDDVNIGPLLDSRFDSEKVDALKRLLALLAQGADVSHHYPQVVKNVASQSLEVKKLVYMYLLHCAENKEDEQHEADAAIASFAHLSILSFLSGDRMKLSCLFIRYESCSPCMGPSHYGRNP